MILQIIEVLISPIRKSKTKANYKLLLDGKAVGTYQYEAEAMRARAFLIDHERGHYVARQKMLGNNDAQTSDVLMRDVYIDAKHALQLIFPDQQSDLYNVAADYAINFKLKKSL